MAMKIRCIPSSSRWMDSFYIGNLVRSLQMHSMVFDLPANESDDLLAARWLLQTAGSVNVLHFHWTHYHYTTTSWLRSTLELLKFVGKLVLARRLRYRIVWTMHNYMPHERMYPLLHYIERFMLARLAHAVIVHCHYGQCLVQRKLLRHKNVYVIPLGNYGPFLPPRHPRRSARERLGLADDETVFLFFGSIRPYKQVPHLLREFTSTPGTNLRLLITGVPLDTTLKTEILGLAALDARVLVRLERVSDEDLALFLGSADAVILPFRDILGSGSAMLALASGLPVIAPRLGCLAELLTPDCSILYEPGPKALGEALNTGISADLQAMGEAARARAQEFPWDTMVQRTLQVYRGRLD